MTGAKKMICSLQSTKIQLVAGCWFCHNQSAAEMRYLRHNYPEYWKLLLKWDKDSPIRFAVHHTVEDLGVVFPADTHFRWKWVEEYFDKTK